MLQIIDTTPLIACVDCLMLVANGETPEGDDTLPDRINSRWSVSNDTCDIYGAIHGSLWWDIALGGEHDILVDEHSGSLGFSWSPCDCCGSQLGGDRYPLTALLWRKP